MLKQARTNEPASYLWQRVLKEGIQAAAAQHGPADSTLDMSILHGW